MKALKMNKLGFAAIVASFGIAMAMPAHASLKLLLTSGASSVTITDQGPLDLNPIVGAVAWVGAVGSFSTNLAGGTSDPVTGTPTAPLLDLVSQSIGGPGTLTVALTDTDFTALSPLNFAMRVGGTISSQGVNSLSYDAYYDLANGEFALANAIGNLGPFGSGAFSGTTSGTGPGVGGPFSLTQVVTLIHGGAGRLSSFDAELRVVPEPGTLALFGLSILGFGMALRRRAGQSA